MKWMKFLLTVIAILLGSAASAVETLDPSEATPGREGVCITEMDGGERVEIPLTVLGTVGSGTPDGEIVLVRLKHPRFEETGIIAGMSGSPVYLDGKLLGALAYGWPFASEPIGGVTPFARMVELASAPAASGVSARPDFSEIMDAARSGGLGDFVVDWLLPEKSATVEPLPLVVAGGGVPAGRGWLAESWRRMGWVVASGSGQIADGDSGEVVPGSMVAAVMVEGDVTLAAGGTVTEVRGDRLWAFGHPSLGAGSTSMPLARASVVAVLPSMMNSSKFFSVGEPIGAIIADRRDGVLGRLGAEAPMVPISVTVNGRSYSYRAIRHPILMPLLAGYLANVSVGVDGRTFGDQTVAIRVAMNYTDEETASAAATFASSQASVESSAFATAVVAYLEASSFEGPDLGSIDIDLKTVESLEAATILDIVPERRVVRPGEELSVRFRLRPHRGREQTRTITLQIPEEMPEGRVDLVGADGAAWTAYNLRMRPLLPANFSDEVRLVNSVDPSTTIVAVLERGDSAMVMPGGTISAPPSVVFQLRSTLGPNLDTVAYSVFAKVEVRMPFPVSGAQRIPLTVRAQSLQMEKQ